MNVQNHVGCNISDRGVFVGGKVVQEGVDVPFSLFGGLCLFSSNAAEGGKGGDVNSPGIVHDSADNFLDAFDSFRW